MKEWIAKILYQMGLKRVAYKISTKVYWRLTFRNLGKSISKATASFKDLTEAYNGFLNGKNKEEAGEINDR